MARNFTLHSARGDQLLFASMDATERLGELFRFRLRMLGKDAHVDLQRLLGTPMAVHMQMPDGYQRWFHGMVAEIEQTGFVTIDKVAYAEYSATLVPRPWLLTQRSDCRIFSNQTVPEIVRTLLNEAGYSDVKLSLGGNYPKREYCVQYREDSFNFISRLLEQEGIYYFFRHDKDRHTMVLGDGLGAHARDPTFGTLPYMPPAQQRTRSLPVVGEWEAARAVHTTTHSLTDYDPLRPRASLAVSGECGQHDLHQVGGLEAFDYPGCHVETADGERYAQVRAEAHNVERSCYRGHTHASGMSVGALFELKDFPRREWNREYLVIGTSMRLEESEYASGQGGGEGPFDCRFEAIESRLPFRSAARARRPLVAGLQTATVAGDKDEDINVDEYGRIRVVFHWNVAGRKGDDVSCPVRVASSWAGKGWGAVNIPRVGHEVVVSFLEGDPDRPLVIGSVYNADHMPPWKLPDNRTWSGIRSRSHLGGGEDFNEIRFEDKKGSEALCLHAQKDMRETVEHDHFVTVDNDETLEVKNDQAEKIGNDRKQDVGNNDTTKVGKKFKIDAGSEIELVTGQSSIVMKSSGEITIKGTNIIIKGQQSVKAEGGMEVDLKAGVKMNIKSDAMLAAEAGAKADLKAPMLTLTGQGIAQLGGGLIKIG